jgi:hypothetical protein
MRKAALLFPLTLALGGCYTVDQSKFERYVNGHVSPGVELSEAEQRLAQDGFQCQASSSAPAVDCSRMQQSLLPYTCVERVLLRAQEGRVASVEVPKIACAGF